MMGGSHAGPNRLKLPQQAHRHQPSHWPGETEIYPARSCPRPHSPPHSRLALSAGGALARNPNGSGDT